jgi:hypothetical protein
MRLNMIDMTIKMNRFSLQKTWNKNTHKNEQFDLTFLNFNSIQFRLKNCYYFNASYKINLKLLFGISSW